MKLQNLSPIERAQLAEKLIDLLSGTDLSAIESHVRANLVALIGTKPATLVTQDAAAQSLETQTRAAFAARDITDNEILLWERQVRDTLGSSNAPKDQYEACGFDPPSKTRSTVIAQTPSGLSVVGFSNGVNRGEFKGNNKGSSGITFEVWRREGDEGAWGIRLTVKTGVFEDKGVTPGQYYEYKVKAKATKTESNFSNTAVVYGQ
jgi:hypothetical protein